MDDDNQSSFESNGTYNGYYRPTRPTWYWGTMGLICVVTTIGNSIVILLIFSKKTLRSKVSPNWFILSLGFADFMVGAYNIPSLLICSLATKCTFLETGIVYSFISIFLTASTVNICLLTFDIYLGVFHPFLYHIAMSPSRARLMIIGAWVFSVILNIPMIVSATTHPYGNKTAETASMVITIISTAVPGVFLMYAYARIFKVVQGHKKDIEKHVLQLATNSHSQESIMRTSGSECSGPVDRVRRKNRDGTITATGVVTANYIICNAFWQYYLLHRLWPGYIPMRPTLLIITRLVLYCNSTMNFVVYALLRKDLRIELESYFIRIYKKLVPKSASN